MQSTWSHSFVSCARPPGSRYLERLSVKLPEIWLNPSQEVASMIRNILPAAGVVQSFQGYTRIAKLRALQKQIAVLGSPVLMFINSR